MVSKLVKSKGVPSTGSIFPVGMGVALTVVYISAFIFSTNPRRYQFL
ncbi:MAG: hypothetical protein ABJA57_07895 [Ginsengibacter sp.]